MHKPLGRTSRNERRPNAVGLKTPVVSRVVSCRSRRPLACTPSSSSPKLESTRILRTPVRMVRVSDSESSALGSAPSSCRRSSHRSRSSRSRNCMRSNNRCSCMSSRTNRSTNSRSCTNNCNPYESFDERFRRSTNTRCLSMSTNIHCNSRCKTSNSCNCVDGRRRKPSGRPSRGRLTFRATPSHGKGDLRGKLYLSRNRLKVLPVLAIMGCLSREPIPHLDHGKRFRGGPDGSDGKLVGIDSTLIESHATMKRETSRSEWQALRFREMPS